MAQKVYKSPLEQASAMISYPYKPQKPKTYYDGKKGATTFGMKPKKPRVVEGTYPKMPNTNKYATGLFTGQNAMEIPTEYDPRLLELSESNLARTIADINKGGL